MKYKKAFTLIEMLVTIIIIAIVTAASVMGLMRYKSRTYFDDAVSQVHGEVLKAQSLAMSPGDTDAASYVLTINTDKTYRINMIKKSDGLPGDDLDSGRISNKVTLTPSSLTVTFQAGTGVVTQGNIDITIADANPESEFIDKTISITAAGSVELQ